MTEKELRRAVSNIVLDIREGGDYSLKETADILRCSDTSVRRMENGYFPRLEKLLKICEAHGYEIIIRKKVSE